MDATSVLPRWFVPSLHGYRGAWLRADVVAGLPVAVGLYTCMVPVVLYALLGGSRTLSVSTTSTIALLTASALAGSGTASEDLLRAAFTLTVLVGVCLLAMRLVRLGSLVEQISLDADLAREGTTLLLAGFAPEVARQAHAARWWARADDAGRVLPTVDAAVSAARTAAP